MPTFKLVNPRIIGEFEDVTDAPTSGDAAENLWIRLSPHLVKNVPKFIFTLEQSGGTLHHFRVTESPQGKLSNYSITQLPSPDNDNDDEKTFRNEVRHFERRLSSLRKSSGGRRNRYDNNEETTGEKCAPRDGHGDDEDDDDTSTTEALYEKIKMLKNLNSPQPIVYVWYEPYLYRRYRVGRVYFPVFNAPLAPYIDLNLSSAFLG